MKKRNKKYNPIRYTEMINQLEAEKYFKGKGLWYCSKDDGALLIDHKEMKVYQLNTKAVGMFTNIPFKWNVSLIVYGYESNGKQRVEIQDPYTKSHLRHNHPELMQVISETHKEMVERFSSKNKFLNAAWFATPNGEVLCAEQSSKLLELTDSW